MSKELKERLVNKAHATVEGLVNKASAAVEEIALQVVQDEVESPHMLGIDNARFLYESDDLVRWYQEKFCMKECVQFVANHEGSTQRCSCGRLRHEHERKNSNSVSETWSSAKHTRQKPTNAFGTVSFSTEQQDASLGAEYVRITDNTTPEAIWDLMRKVWALKPPTLFLSIVGGNRKTQLDVNIKHSLEGGLGKVIQQTDVWLITGATKTQVTKLAAKAFHENHRRDRSMKNACIGIAPWGCIGEREQLHGQMSNILYRKLHDQTTETTLLEKNHTQFLLVDDGTEKKFGVERKFRAKLERFLSNPTDCKVIPSATILVEGGQSACMQIKENLQSHPQIPTVVIKRSGGLADILENALVAHKESNKKGLRLLMYIKNELSKTLVLDGDAQKLAKIAGSIKEIVEEHTDKVIIYDPKGDPYGLHHAIMEACKSSSSESMDRFNRLQLAIHLGELEIAAKDIQETGNIQYMRETLYKSIKKGKAKFVEFLLLKCSIDLEVFLGENMETLQRLYVRKVKHDTFFRRMLTMDEKQRALQVQKDKSFDMNIIDRLLQKYMEEDYTPCHDKSERFRLRGGEVKLAPIQELMIWAVLNNMQELIEIFWRHDTIRPLENALVIFRIYRKMSKDFLLDEIEALELRKVADVYEQKAVEILTAFYKQNSKSAVDVVKTRIPIWGFKNPVSLAANGYARDFVAHTCCQNYLKDIWSGRRERRTVKSELVRFRERLHVSPRKRLHSAAAERRQKKYRKEEPIDETDTHKDLPRCTRICNMLSHSFLFLFLVPKGKLFLHAFLYTIFLGCFAFLVLVKKGTFHKPLLYIVLSIVSALTIDEMRQIAEIRKRTLWMKIREWSRSVWNKLDIVAMLLFFVGFGWSFYDRRIERVVLAVDLVIWVIKFAQFYRMFSTLGPYLIMIYRMMFHMLGFVLVLIIAVVAYGIFMHTLLFPDVTVSWQILFKVLFRPFLLVFGELGINSYALSSNTTVYGTKKVDEGTEIVVVVGMCTYLLLANVLLLNMLIAVFNNIYEDVKMNSDKIWRFDRYDMIMEFKNKPSVPIPFSAITNIPRVLFHLCRNETHRFYEPETKDHQLDMEDFQHRCTRAYLRECDKMSSETLEDNMALVKERTENNSKTLGDMEEKLEVCLSAIDNLTKKTTTDSTLRQHSQQDTAM